MAQLDAGAAPGPARGRPPHHTPAPGRREPPCATTAVHAHRGDGHHRPHARRRRPHHDVPRRVRPGPGPPEHADEVVSVLRTTAQRSLAEGRTHCVAFDTAAETWTVRRATCATTGAFVGAARPAAASPPGGRLHASSPARPAPPAPASTSTPAAPRRRGRSHRPRHRRHHRDRGRTQQPCLALVTCSAVDDAGFTLVEVLVAFLILGLVAAAMVPLLVLGSTAATQTRMRDRGEEPRPGTTRADAPARLPRRPPERPLRRPARQLLPPTATAAAGARHGWVSDRRPPARRADRFVLPDGVRPRPRQHRLHARSSPPSSSASTGRRCRRARTPRTPARPPVSTARPSLFVGVTVLTSWTANGQAKVVDVHPDLGPRGHRRRSSRARPR